MTFNDPPSVTGPDQHTKIVTANIVEWALSNVLKARRSANHTESTAV